MTKGEWIGIAFLVFILGGTVVMAAVMAKVMPNELYDQPREGGQS